MVKEYCIDCGVFLFEESKGLLGGVGDFLGGEKKGKHVEYKEGYKCEKCSQKIGGKRK